MKNKKYLITTAALAAILTVGGAFNSFAAAPSDNNPEGSQKGGWRRAPFEEVKNTDGTEENEAVFDKKSDGGSRFAKKPRLNPEELVEAGIISQDVLDSIKEYASERHDKISAEREETKGMTPQERREYYADTEKDREPRDGIDELVEDGIITREQADSIKEYISENCGKADESNGDMSEMPPRPGRGFRGGIGKHGMNQDEASANEQTDSADESETKEI